MKRRTTMVSTIQKQPPAGAYKAEPGGDDHHMNSRCCARCRRGIPGYGELPCGWNWQCPNPKCLHAKETK